LVIVVVAEMFIGSTDGLGQRVSRRNSFAAGALGYGLNLLQSSKAKFNGPERAWLPRGQNRAINLKSNARTTL